LQGKRRKEQASQAVRCWWLLLVPPGVGPWVTHYSNPDFTVFGSPRPAPIGYSRVPTRMWHPRHCGTTTAPSSCPSAARPTSRPTFGSSLSVTACFVRRVRCLVYSWKPCSGISLFRSPSQHGLEAIRRRAGSRRRRGHGDLLIQARWSLTTACQRLDDLFLPATATTYRPIAHQHALHDPSPSDHMPVSLKHIYHAPLWQDQLIFPPIRS
jgi:hypothetical protein